MVALTSADMPATPNYSTPLLDYMGQGQGGQGAQPPDEIARIKGRR
jgi:hypothetical protein